MHILLGDCSMSQSSKELRQAVFQALICAQSAAATHKMISAMDELLGDLSLRNEVKKISEAAYAATAHAWMAMIALIGNQLEIAQNAAQAAYKAEQVVSRGAFLFNLSNTKTRHQDRPCVVPDERGLNDMWQTLCSSLPHQFPVPDTLDQSLSPIIDN
jgi:hypothetical protein